MSRPFGIPKKRYFLAEKFNWKPGPSATGSQTSALGNTAKAAPSTATVNASQPFANSSAFVADHSFFFKFYYTKESNRKAKATYPSHCTEGSERYKYFLMSLISAAKN